MPRHTSQCYKYRNATVTQCQKQKCLSSIFSMENIFLKNQIILVAFSALISYHSDRKTSCSTQFKSTAIIILKPQIRSSGLGIE